MHAFVHFFDTFDIYVHAVNMNVMRNILLIKADKGQ